MEMFSIIIMILLLLTLIISLFYMQKKENAKNERIKEMTFNTSEMHHYLIATLNEHLLDNYDKLIAITNLMERLAKTTDDNYVLNQKQFKINQKITEKIMKNIDEKEPNINPRERLWSNLSRGLDLGLTETELDDLIQYVKQYLDEEGE